MESRSGIPPRYRIVSARKPERAKECVERFRARCDYNGLIQAVEGGFVGEVFVDGVGQFPKAGFCAFDYRGAGLLQTSFGFASCLSLGLTFGLAFGVQVLGIGEPFLAKRLVLHGEKF